MEGTPEIEATMGVISVHLQPNDEREHHYNRVYEAVQKFYCEQQKKLETAINIILKEDGPNCQFIELEDDAGHGLGIGQRISYGEFTKIRITIADIKGIDA